MSEIKLVRIYDHQQPAGYRILVDRMWPRGVSKVKAQLNAWDKEIGPTNELRKWFNHEDEKFPEFKQKYIEELNHNQFTPEFVENVKNNLEKSINVYKTIIPRNIRLAEAPSHGIPIQIYDPKSAGAESYRSLAKEIIGRKNRR